MASRQRAVGPAGVLCLVALLLVPIAIGGHAHRDPAAANGCAACVVVHHAPAVAPATVTSLPAVLTVRPYVTCHVTEPTDRMFAVQRDRGPPSRPLSLVV